MEQPPHSSPRLLLPHWLMVKRSSKAKRWAMAASNGVGKDSAGVTETTGDGATIVGTGVALIAGATFDW